MSRSHKFVVSGILFAFISVTAWAAPAAVSGKKLYDAVYGLMGKTYSDMPTIQKLVDSGEDVNYVNPANGQSVLWVAVSKGDFGNTDAMTASRRQYAVDVAKILIAKGVKLDVADTKTGQTPLVLALGLLNMDCAKLLMDSGADPTIPTTGGLTALHLAAYADVQGDIVAAIIKKGGNVNLQAPEDYVRMTPLHFAVRTGNKAAIDLLLKNGAKIDGGDTYSATPLYYAAYYDKLDIFQMLMENGASLDTKFTKPAKLSFMSYWPAGQNDILPANQEGFTPAKIASYRSARITEYLSPDNLAQLATVKEFKQLPKYASSDVTEFSASGAPSGKSLNYLAQTYIYQNDMKGLEDIRVTSVTVIKEGKSSASGFPIRLSITAKYLKKMPDAKRGWVYTTGDLAITAQDFRLSKDDFDEWTIVKM